MKDENRHVCSCYNLYKYCIETEETKMELSLTAIYQKSSYGYIGYVEELPGANTQGTTLEETKINLKEAIQLVLEANRQIAEEESSGKETIKEAFGTISV